MYPIAEKFIKDFRGGSSLSVLVEATGGVKRVIKWKGTGEGPIANAVDWLCLHLARLAGIQVPMPHLIIVPPEFIHQAEDPDIKDLIMRSHGFNLSVEFIEDAVPFKLHRADTIDLTMKNRIYCFDVLFLNIDRTDINPNIVFSHDDMFCLDFAASLAMKMLINGERYSEKTSLPLLRRHPFYSEKNKTEIIEPVISAEAVQEIIHALPDEWLTNARATKEQIFSGIMDTLNNARTILEHRLQILDETHLETMEERDARMRANRNAFASKWSL